MMPLFVLGMTRDQEIWGMALWVERHHGPDGQAFIAAQIDRLAGDPQGQAIWRRVGAKLNGLQPSNPVLC